MVIARTTEAKRKSKQGVQGLQTFAFCAVNANDEHMMNIDSKESLGVKFKDSIYVELRLKLWFENDSVRMVFKATV